MYYAQKFNLKKLDIIKSSLGIFSKHYALYLGSYLGNELIAENHNIEGVRIILASQYFFEHSEIDEIRRFSGSTYQEDLAIQRLKKLVGTPYNLITYNCEHFVNEVLYGRSESIQVKNAVGLLALGMFCYGLSKIK